MFTIFCIKGSLVLRFNSAIYCPWLGELVNESCVIAMARGCAGGGGVSSCHECVSAVAFWTFYDLWLKKLKTQFAKDSRKYQSISFKVNTGVMIRRVISDCVDRAYLLSHLRRGSARTFWARGIKKDEAKCQEEITQWDWCISAFSFAKIYIYILS